MPVVKSMQVNACNCRYCKTYAFGDMKAARGSSLFETCTGPWWWRGGYCARVDYGIVIFEMTPAGCPYWMVMLAVFESVLSTPVLV
jgi:hypothetical protein